MLFIIIIAIAAVILIYFAFSGGSSDSAPAIRDDRIEESVVNATVKDINIHENMVKREHYLTYFITFDCEDEITREFQVPLKLHDAVEIGERGELVYAGERFIGFGNHGAVEIDSGIIEEDGFTYDDYDESIDVELEAAAAGEASGLDADNQEYFALFRDRKILPSETQIIEDETASLREYSAVSLLEKITVYPFLKREDAVRRIFFKTYDEAMDDLLGFEGGSRKGSAADSDSINRNEIRVLITVQENPPPLMSRITAEFGVNE